jgi:hypothetical protein
MNDKGVLTHLRSEFAVLKETSIDQSESWRIWWKINKEKFKFLYPISQVLLTLAPTEASGK